MRKLDALRRHLLDAVPSLAQNPDRLRTYIPEGNLFFYRGPTLSHEYRCSAEIVVIGHAGEIDAITVPLLQWLNLYQPDIEPESIRFSAEIHKHDDIDLIYSVDLTERVVATVDCECGRIDVEHRMPEYPIDACGPTDWDLYIRGPGDDDYQPVSHWHG